MKKGAKPLRGLKIVVTRPKDQAAELMKNLAALGAQPISIPAIHIRPVRPNPRLDKALAGLERYDYLVFTSRNGVEIFFDELAEKGIAKKRLAHLTTACIGPATAKAMKRRRIRCDIQPSAFIAESLLAAFPRRLAGKKILIPRAREAREVLPRGLRKRGAKVDVIPVYESVPAEPAPKLPPDTDVVVFTSGSTAASFLPRVKLPRGAKIAVIGPVTQKEVERHGCRATIAAEEFTAAGLVRAIVKVVENGKLL